MVLHNKLAYSRLALIDIWQLDPGLYICVPMVAIWKSESMFSLVLTETYGVNGLTIIKVKGKMIDMNGIKSLKI